MCIQQVKLCCVHEGMSAQIAEIKQSSSQKYFTSTQNYFSLNLVGDTIVCWPKKDVKWFDFISHQTTSPNLIQCQQNFLLRFQIFVWNLFSGEQWWTTSTKYVKDETWSFTWYVGRYSMFIWPKQHKSVILMATLAPENCWDANIHHQHQIMEPVTQNYNLLSEHCQGVRKRIGKWENDFLQKYNAARLQNNICCKFNALKATRILEN